MSRVFQTNPTALRPQGLACSLVHLDAGMRYCLYDRAAHDFVGAEEGYPTEEAARAAARILSTPVFDARGVVVFTGSVFQVNAWLKAGAPVAVQNL